MTVVRIIIVFVIGILLFIIALNNITPVEEVYVFKVYTKIPLAVIMLYSFIFGLITAGLFWLVNELKLRTSLRRQKKENEALLAELTALRNLPLDIERKRE